MLAQAVSARQLRHLKFTFKEKSNLSTEVSFGGWKLLLKILTAMSVGLPFKIQRLHGMELQGMFTGRFTKKTSLRVKMMFTLQKYTTMQQKKPNQCCNSVANL